MEKKRKGPPLKYRQNNVELEAKGEKARAQFHAAVDAIPAEVKEEIEKTFNNFQKIVDTISVEDKEEINTLKKEQIKEEEFWKGYSNKLKEQVLSEDIFKEVQNFKTLKKKENKNFFKKILKTLGF